MPVIVGGIPGSSSRLGGGLAAVNPLMVSDVMPMMIAQRLASLGRVRRSINGQTKDASGNPLGSCTVEIVRTSNDSKIDKQNSDANGLYDISVYDDGPFYAVAYKAGAPDVAGTTVNTLVGV